MNFVPCIAWVPRGKAASTPHKLQLSPQELKRLVNETKGLANKCSADDIDEEDYSDKDSEQEIEEHIEQENEEKNEQCNENEVDEDFDARYNLDSYDNDDEENPIFTINDLAVHVDNHDDDYLTEEESEGDLEDKQDYLIKDSDNLIVSGHVDDKCSILEIRVYNQEEDSLYVHHDIVLAYYPLALAWLDFDPADEKPGNYIAIGDMSSVIKIYDLDVVDVLEPEYTLGKMFDPENTKKKKKSKEYHTDAVLSVSWNKSVRNLLASGSADSSVIVWDLSEGTVLNKFSFHSNKVQALEWHPTESQFLLSGCTDGFLKLYDCQSVDDCKSWQVEGEIEKIVWSLNDSFKFFSSTDQGCIYVFDIRNEGIEKQFQAHEEAITGLDMSPLRPDILISASMDETLKVWDIMKDYKMIKSLKLNVGSIYAAKVASDLDLTVAVGGNKASDSFKVIDIFKRKKDTQRNVKKNFELFDNKNDIDLSLVKKENVDTQGNVKNEFGHFDIKNEVDLSIVKKENTDSHKKDQYKEKKFQKNKKFKYSYDTEENCQAFSNIEVATKHKKQRDSKKK